MNNLNLNFFRNAVVNEIKIFKKDISKFKRAEDFLSDYDKNDIEDYDYVVIELNKLIDKNR